MEKRFPAESPPDLDFGASWARFWEVWGSNFTAFTRTLRSAGELLRSKTVSRTFQVRASKKSGASRSMSNQVFLRAKTAPRRLQDAPRRAKICQDAPKRARRRPKTLPRCPKMPPRGAKTPQDSENGAKMEPSWHQHRSKWKVIFENLQISQIVLSLQRGLDFRRFGA